MAHAAADTRQSERHGKGCRGRVSFRKSCVPGDQVWLLKGLKWLRYMRSFRRFQDDEEKVDTNCSVNLLVTFGWIILKRKVESYHLPHIAIDETVAPKNSPGSVGSCWSNPWPSGRRYQEAGGVTFHSIPSIPSIPESVRLDYVLWCKIACSEGAIVGSPFIFGIDELGMAYLWGSSSASSKWMEARLVPC